MKLKKWRPFLCICTGHTLLMSTTASVNLATITPLEEGQISSFQPGNQTFDQVAASSQEPGSESGSDGGVILSDGSSSFGSPSPSESPFPTGNLSPLGSPSLSGGPSWDPTTGQAAGGNSGGAVSPGETAGIAVGTFDQTAATSVQKLEVAPEGAVLMDVAAGTVLFSKNGDKQFYPASIIKPMTVLLTAEGYSLDDKITFSAAATANLEAGAVPTNMATEDVMTVCQCLYALFPKPANEAGNVLVEHVAGNNTEFAEMTNAKAAALGCINTHFTNLHGLNDSSHYTTFHDTVLIARVAFRNDVVETVASTRTYTLPTTIENPSELTMAIGYKMLNPNDARYCPGAIGGKIGYMSKAGNALVTAVKKDGIRSITAIIEGKSAHYMDTKALFDHGYELVEAGALSGNGSSTGSSNNAGTTSSSSGMGDVGPGISSVKSWIQDSNGWYHVKNSGAKAANEWVTVDGASYWIDSNTYMARRWCQVSGKWYLLRSNGTTAKNQWEKVEENDQWFYLGVGDAVLTSTTTPDGSRVGESGTRVWWTLYITTTIYVVDG